MDSTDKDKQAVVVTHDTHTAWFDNNEWNLESKAHKKVELSLQHVPKDCNDYFDENGNSNLSKGEIKERRENGDYTRHKLTTDKQDQFRNEQWRLKKKRAKLKRKRKRR